MIRHFHPPRSGQSEIKKVNYALTSFPSHRFGLIRWVEVLHVLNFDPLDGRSVTAETKTGSSDRDVLDN